MKNSFPITREDLIQYHNDEQVVRKTADQVIKDFAQFGIDIIFPGDLHMAYNDLFDQLAPHIRFLIRENQTKFYSLLYRIDLNESTIQKGSHTMSDLPLYDVITHLILERELMKVLTRIYFSKNP